MEKKKFGLNSFVLHIIAMTFMLIDHMWVTNIIKGNWVVDVGRIAFLIFAFMIVEGYFHTKNVRKYIKRLFVFAIISEIPFNRNSEEIPRL